MPKADGEDKNIQLDIANCMGKVILTKCPCQVYYLLEALFC